MVFSFRYLSGRRKFLTFLLAAVQTLSFVSAPESHAADSDNSAFVRLVAPREGAEIIAKKPEIQVVIEKPFSGLVVGLDGVDITAMLNKTDKGFMYTPLQVLPSGVHTIYIGFYSENGSAVERKFTFSTRHTKAFEEASANNNLDATYQGVLEKSDEVQGQPYSRIDANLKSGLFIKEKGWEFRFNSGVRFLDQNLPALDPEKKGVNLINYLMQGSHKGEKSHFLVELGDVQISESDYTVQGVARRGGRVSFSLNGLNSVDELTVNAFVVNGKEVYGFRNIRDGTGISFNTDAQIMGISAEAGFLSRKMTLKTTYVSGGEEGNSFGISTEPGGVKGDVWGLVLRSDFFEQKLITEIETAFSEFDADTSDTFRKESDKSYRLKMEGHSGMFTYRGSYYYLGPKFGTVGNQGLQNDLEGVEMGGGATFGIHSVNITLTKYNDNVKSNDLLPRVNFYGGTIEYAFRKFQTLPMGLSYQKTVADSSREPAGVLPYRADTDTVAGWINYTRDAWSLGFQTGYSIEDKEGENAGDTSTTTCGLTSRYAIEHFSVSTGLTFNHSRISADDLRTDTYAANLDIRGDALGTKLNYGVIGAYTRSQPNTGLHGDETATADFEVTYKLRHIFLDFLNPAAGIRGHYGMSRSEAVGTGTTQHNEFTLLLILTTTMPFSF
jgi:hypothetical protein